MKKLFLNSHYGPLRSGLRILHRRSRRNGQSVVVSEILRALGGNVLVNVPEENFDVNIPADAASWVQINEAESSGKSAGAVRR